ncbi:MAG: TolC family protein [Syntrophales bacterium]|nr:TolC family protein [Syntrophales bacterium]
MLRILIATLLVHTLALPGHTEVLPEIRYGEKLALSRLIEIALRKHPTLVAASNNTVAAETRIDLAKSNLYPQLNWSNSVQRIDPYHTPKGKIPATTGDVYNNYTTSINVSQNIYDFKRTGTQIEIQKMNAKAANFELEATKKKIILGVRQAYYNLLKASHQRSVAVETVNQFQQHLEQARKLFEVGMRPKIDVTKAEVDLSNARLNLLKAENTLKLAIASLNSAIGCPDAPEYTVEDDTNYTAEVISFEEALKTAYENRPDLKAQLARVEANRQAITLAKTGYLPTITGTASIGYGGQQFPIDEGWSVAASLNIPLFSGFSTTYEIQESLANLEVARANAENLRQSIYLEVRQAYLNINEALGRIENARIAIQQAEENRELVIGRYNAGLGNSIEVADAIAAASNAKLNYWSAFYDLKSEIAALEKAMGK